jgi:hypothetical protein
VRDSQYIVLVSDFANVNEAIGPFETSAEAHQWADRNVQGEIYRVVEMRPPTESNLIVTRLMD